jgi:hypothetical protein
MNAAACSSECGDHESRQGQKAYEKGAGTISRSRHRNVGLDVWKVLR